MSNVAQMETPSMHRLHCIRSPIRFAMFATIALLHATGCQTLTSLGIPVFSPYELSDTAERISQSHTRAAALPREMSEEVLSAYIVEPGDVLLLEPAEFDSPIRLPGDQPVQPDGTIEMGRYGRMQVAGLTLLEIQNRVQATINATEVARRRARIRETDDDGENVNKDQNVVTVRLVDWKSKVFYVIGEVNSPGVYPYSGNEKVLDALLAAGDITRRANRHQIILSRATDPCDNRIVLPICYDNVVQIGDTSSNYQIAPGDRIFVPGISFFGDVKQSLCSHLPGGQCCPRCGPQQSAKRIPTIQCVTPCSPVIVSENVSTNVANRPRLRR